MGWHARPFRVMSCKEIYPHTYEASFTALNIQVPTWGAGIEACRVWRVLFVLHCVCFHQSTDQPTTLDIGRCLAAKCGFRLPWYVTLSPSGRVGVRKHRMKSGGPIQREGGHLMACRASFFPSVQALALIASKSNSLDGRRFLPLTPTTPTWKLQQSKQDGHGARGITVLCHAISANYVVKIRQKNRPYPERARKYHASPVPLTGNHQYIMYT